MDEQWEDHNEPIDTGIPLRALNWVRRLVVEGDSRPVHRDPYIEKWRRASKTRKERREDAR